MQPSTLLGDKQIGIPDIPGRSRQNGTFPNIFETFWNPKHGLGLFMIVYVIVFSYVCDKFGTPDMEGLFLCLSQVRTFGVRKRKYHGPCTLWCHQMWHAGKYPNSSPKFSSSKMEDIQNIRWCLPSGVIKILVLR